MNFGEYFNKYLLNDSSIKEKMIEIKKREVICNNIIDDCKYIEWLIDYLNNNNDENIEYLNYFYFAIKEFLEKNYYYEFYDYNNFVIKYKNTFLEFNYSGELICKILNDSDVYIDFSAIVNKKESINKEKYINYFNELGEIKKVIPKKLIKEKLDL